MADLFDLGDLPSWLQVPEVDTATATRIRRAVSGWLQDATGLTAWPDPVPDDLWAWAVELAAMVHENPTSNNADTVGATSVQFGDRARRAEILAAARRRYGSAGPVGSFPEPDWSWTASTVGGSGGC